MGGFFRRLRRGKEAPTEEEPAPDSAPEPDANDSAAGEASTESEESGATLWPAKMPPPPTPPTAPAAPTSTVPTPTAPTAPTPPPANSPPARSGPPPPLPQADRDAARSSIAPRRTTSTTCFMCGTPMDGAWCPTCRMAWTE